MAFGGLMAACATAPIVQANRGAEITATFERIHRPLRWPMENFARKRVANREFTGYRFSRVVRRSVAGFCFGFSLQNEGLPGITDAPEVVAYAFVEPQSSALHRDLVVRSNSVVRRLVSVSRTMGFPFEFHAKGPVAAVRHRTMRPVPPELFVHVASDFLMLCYQPLRAARFLERVKDATARPG